MQSKIAPRRTVAERMGKVRKDELLTLSETRERRKMSNPGFGICAFWTKTRFLETTPAVVVASGLELRSPHLVNARLLAGATPGSAFAYPPVFLASQTDLLPESRLGFRQ